MVSNTPKSRNATMIENIVRIVRVFLRNSAAQSKGMYFSASSHSLALAFQGELAVYAMTTLPAKKRGTQVSREFAGAGCASDQAAFVCAVLTNGKSMTVSAMWLK